MLQLRAAALIAVGQPLWRRAAAEARLDLAEQLMGKGVDVRHAGNERPPLFGAGAGVVQQRGAALRQFDAPRLPAAVRRGAAGGEAAVRHRVGDEGAATGARRHVAFRQQLFING